MSIAQKIFELKREFAKHEGQIFTLEINSPAYFALCGECPLEINRMSNQEKLETVFGIKIVRNDWCYEGSHENGINN